MKKSVWVFLLLAGVNTSYSQCSSNCGPNLISNADFEASTSNCSDTISEMFTNYTQVTGWYGTACDTCAGNGSTPDYHNSNCNGPSTSEVCGSGSGSIGIFTSVDIGGSLGTNAREYVQKQLNSTLVAGQEYCITAKVKSNTAMSPSVVVSDGFGFWFTDQKVDIDVQNNGEQYIGPGSNINATPQVSNPSGNMIGSSCVTISGTFCATGNEDWIVLGNFKTDAQTQTTATCGFFSLCFGYLIIDDISLSTACNSNPTLSSSADTLACAQSVDLEINNVPSSASIEWLSPAGFTGYTSTGPYTDSPSSTTTYTAVTEFTNSCGTFISDTLSAQVVVDCGPQVSINLSSDTICQGSCADVTVQVTGGTSPYTIDWNNGSTSGTGPFNFCPDADTTFNINVTDDAGITNSVSTNLVVLDTTITPVSATICASDSILIAGVWQNSAGTYYDTLDNQNGCDSIVEHSVSVTPLEDPYFETTDFCVGNANSANNITTPGGSFSFTPDPNDGSSINPSTGAITNAVGGTTYTIEYLTGGSCPDSLTQTVTANPCNCSIDNITIDNTTCLPSGDYEISGSVEFTFAPAGGQLIVENCNGQQQSFSPPFSSPTSFNFNAGNGNASSCHLNAYFTDNTSCSINQNFTEPDCACTPPSFSISANQLTACGAADGEIIISGLTPNTTYQLDYTYGGSTNSLSSTTNNSGAITISGLTSGSYTGFEITLTNCTGTNASSISLSAPSAPSVNAGNDTTLCAGETLTLTAGNPSNANLSWDNGVSDGTSFTPPLGNNTYTVTATDNGCTTTDQVLVNVIPTPNVSAGQNVDLCEGTSTTLNATGAQSYTWSNGGSNGQNVSPATTNTYSVTGIGTNGCSDTDQVIVTVHPNPTAGISASQQNGCLPLDVSFSQTGSNNSNNCLWYFGDDQVSGCNTVKHTFSNEGCYDVALVTTTPNGCTDSVSYKDFICTQQSPTADFNYTPKKPLTTDPQVSFENLSENATSYEWLFNHGDLNSDIDPSYTFPQESGTYEVRLVAFNSGCTDTTYSEIFIDEELLFYVPNTFTPNNDGNNEVFLPIMTSGFNPYEYELLIFNRWGEILFESHNSQVGWDGSYRGKIVQDGVYLWKISFQDNNTDERKSYDGHINVIK